MKDKTNIFFDKQEILNKFLVGNDDLEEISSELGIFNIFKALHIEQNEIRHSNVIAWLLDPRESHSFGETFIKRFISTILLDSEYPQIQPVHIELMNMADVEVLREWKHIDLLVKSPSNKWVLLIESKIKSGSTQHQLQRYIERLKNEKEFKNYKIIPVLLTLFSDEGEDNAEKAGFIHWSHSQMYHVLNQVYNQKQNNMSLEAKVFIQHYLVILRRLTMQDERLIELCKSIYKKHKDAIDLIVQFGMTSQFRAAAESFIKEHGDLIETIYRPHSVWFILKQWRQMPRCINGWVLPYPVACWFNYWQNASKIGLIIEIGPWDNFKKRQNLIKALQDKGFKVGSKAFREESKYTRFYSSYVKIDNEEDPDSMKKHMEDLWLKSQKDLKSTSKVIESFKW